MANSGLDYIADFLGMRKKSSKYTRRNAYSRMRRNYLSLRRFFELCFYNEPDCSNSNYVSLVRLKTVRGDNGLILKTETRTDMPNHDPRIHAQTFECVPAGYSGGLSTAPGIKVYCDCRRFMYKWDYSLFTVGASDGIACQGIPSFETNPNLKLAGCKHLARVSGLILSRGL